MNIQKLTCIEELDSFLQDSHDKYVLFFKHSTRCPVSHAADREYHEFVNQYESKDAVTFVQLDLIQHRDVSNAIAEKLSITHQSPQAILVKDGKVVWNASHGEITQKTLKNALMLMATIK